VLLLVEPVRIAPLASTAINEVVLVVYVKNGRDR